MTRTHSPSKDLWMELTDRRKLAKLMAIAEVSQRELALAAGWRSHSYLGRLLRGEVKTLDPRPALLIAKRLECSIDDLFVTKVSTDTGHDVSRGAA